MALRMRQKEFCMNIPYRTRQRLKTAAVIALIVALVAAIIWLCWFIWLKRYVVYTRDGAKLDFSISANVPEGNVAAPPAKEPISIFYNEGENAIHVGKDLIQLTGYYADRSVLIDGIDQVREQTKRLKRGAPVMLEVKSALGNFFYSSAVSEHRDSKVNIEAMDQLIKDLDRDGFYLIARVPALRDRMFGLNNVNDGVFDTRGAYLFRDDGGCYWLNPKRQNVMLYLVQTAQELKSLGFDEVVFDFFDFPDTKYMRFDGDKAEALVTAAETLITSCSSDNFAVSFVQNAGFALPQGRTRLYIKDAAAADAQFLAQQSGLENTEVNLVFITENHDTRFDAFGVLRPIDAVE
jgi:hypothetical protein